MDETNSVNCIVLGNEIQKSIILKIMDSCCINDGDPSALISKFTSKSSVYESLDYLKSNYKIKADSVKYCKIDSEGNLPKKNLKRKLYPVKIKLLGSRNDYVRYYSPLVDSSTCKTPSQDHIKWFSEKLIATTFVYPKKTVRHELTVESISIYCSPVCYKSKGKITFDRNKIIFQIYFKEWFKIELSLNDINSLTAYTKYPFIKLSLKTKIADEISRFYSKYGLYSSDMYKSTPKKASGLKDLMLVFLNKQLNKYEYAQLGAVLGEDKLRWNESERDSKELIENALYKNCHLSEFISINTHPNWSLIFKPKAQENLVNISLKTTPVKSTSSSGSNNNVTPQSITSVDINNFFAACQAVGNDNTSHGQAMSNGTKSSPSSLSQSKSLETTNLMYVPNRNVSNVFDTFHYNPSPESDVLIRGVDLLCLNFGQYLNDNIINFYLNFIRYEVMSDDQRKRTHLFNVFFNTKLQGAETANMAGGTPEDRHARVAKWTKKVDIFDKDFIIIPINENQHWFLSIICFPWMAGMVSYDQLLGVANTQPSLEIPTNNTPFATKHRIERVRKLKEKYGMDPSPCILLFDSLQFQSRAPNLKLIREYLKTEWDIKRSATDGPLVFDKNTIRGFNPQVPRQTNSIDCGIFVLHYVEQFFNHPLKVFTKEYFQSSLLRWFDNETVAKKRASIQKMVLSKADEYFASNAYQNNSDMSTSTAVSIDDSCPDIQIL